MKRKMFVAALLALCLAISVPAFASPGIACPLR